jgi:hypothetical protein
VIFVKIAETQRGGAQLTKVKDIQLTTLAARAADLRDQAAKAVSQMKRL